MIDELRELDRWLERDFEEEANEREKKQVSKEEWEEYRNSFWDFPEDRR